MCRFEHLEHRDGRQAGAETIPFLRWYHNNVDWDMGKNYYVKTFLGDRDPHDYNENTADNNNNNYKKPNYQPFYWSYHRYQRLVISYSQFIKAVNNFRRFHMILVMEWLKTDSVNTVLQKTLGWTSPPRQVLPHEVQARRQNKKSLTAKEILSPQEYNIMIEENIFDLLFFYIAKRIYVERYFCF